MDITSDLKDDILNHTKSIENIEVVYKKKNKYSGNWQGYSKRHLRLPFSIIIIKRKQSTQLILILLRKL